MARLPFGLCCWGMTYTLGVAGGTSSRRNPSPLPAIGLLELAARLNLAGVELAPEMVSPDAIPEDLAAFRTAAAARGLALTLSGSSISDANGTSRLMATLDMADRLGAGTVRLVLSSILCGDRRQVGGLAGWKGLLDRAARSLTLLAREAGARKIRLAVENHQDATAEDLVWLCEAVDSPFLGITLDTGNPLAVGQAILPYARRVLPHLVNVHLKDYTVHGVEDGYVLARCALGDGVVPFPELLEMFSGRELSLQLELAALDSRRIPMTTPDYWRNLGMSEIPGPGHAAMVMRQGAATGVDFRTPWERSADAELPGYEMMQVERSTAYLAGLVPRSTA